MREYLHRLYRNIFMGPLEARRLFTDQVMRELQGTIEESERKHAAELQLVIDGGLSLPELLSPLSSRQKAIELFSHLRVWDTEANNGVLLYLLVAEHSIEIVADRGITSKIRDGAWEKICDDMVASFKKGKYQQGVQVGIEEITAVLAEHFPPGDDRRNELHDAPIRL